MTPDYDTAEALGASLEVALPCIHGGCQPKMDGPSHRERCPAHYRPVMATLLADKDSWYLERLKEAGEHICELDDLLADTNAEIARLRGLVECTGDHDDLIRSNESLRARITDLEAALRAIGPACRYWADTCEGKTPGQDWCGGCVARAALATGKEPT